MRREPTPAVVGAGRGSHDPRHARRGRPLLIDLAHHACRSTPCRPARRRNDRQPHPGPVPQPGHRRWSTHPTDTTRAPQEPPTLSSPPSTACAVRRRRQGPTAASRSTLPGRSWTPTPHPGAPKNRRRTARRKIKDQEHRFRGLTGPAPSGMTARNARTTRLTSRNSQTAGYDQFVQHSSGRLSAVEGLCPLQFRSSCCGQRIRSACRRDSVGALVSCARMAVAPTATRLAGTPTLQPAHAYPHPTAVTRTRA